MNNLALLPLIHARAFPRRWDQPTPGDWADLLAKAPLFAGVSKRRLRKLARSSTLVEFAPGERIVVAGDRGHELYLVLSGHAKTMESRSGRTLRPGDYFGDVALIDSRPRTATIVARSYVHAMRLPSHSVLELARRHPAVTLTLLRDVVTTQLRRLEAEDARAA